MANKGTTPPPSGHVHKRHMFITITDTNLTYTYQLAIIGKYKSTFYFSYFSSQQTKCEPSHLQSGEDR